MAKNEYANALRALEQISDDIHKRRERNKLNEALASMPREDGVGAESDDEVKTAMAEDRYQNDLFLGETVDGLDKDITSSLRSKLVVSDSEEDLESEHGEDSDIKSGGLGERPSVSGSEGNNGDDGTTFSDIDLS